LILCCVVSIIKGTTIREWERVPQTKKTSNEGTQQKNEEKTTEANNQLPPPPYNQPAGQTNNVCKFLTNQRKKSLREVGGSIAMLWTVDDLVWTDNKNDWWWML
jgi:hypothetical protein